MPLPTARFELTEHRTATVQFNYHIVVEKMYYSVPHQYIREKVDVRMTSSIIEIFKDNKRIASHKRIFWRPGQYSTEVRHMPPDHQKFLEWNGDRFRRWAKTIGENTFRVIDAILLTGKVEQQSYRACMGLLKLAEHKSPERLEQACEKALTYASMPSYKFIRSILINDKFPSDSSKACEEPDDSRRFGITRGAKHYGGSK